MSSLTNLSCWEIIKCKKKCQCSHENVNNNPCWKVIQDDDACSFHICVDCLVYLAKSKDSFLTEEEFFSIMEYRKNARIEKDQRRLSDNLLRE